MKKLISLGLAFLALATQAQTQNHQSQNFLNVSSIVVSNTAGYTNLSPYWGQDPLRTTNANLLAYTNSLGTLIFDFMSNTNTGLTVLSNGVAFNTNDVAQLTHDVLYHADAFGNLCTNVNISFATIGTVNATNNIVATFIPIIKGGTFNGGPIVGVIPPVLGNGGPGTVLDTNAIFTIYATVTKNWPVGSSFSLSPTNILGYKGLRLFTLNVTNSTGQVVVSDVSLNGFGP